MTTTVTIPDDLADSIRQVASERRISVDQIIRETLDDKFRERTERQKELIALLGEKKRDLSDLAGTWVEDPEFDRAMAEMDQIDPEMWR